MIRLQGILIALAALAPITLATACGSPTTPPANWSAPSAPPQSTPLARAYLAFDSNRTGNFELFAMRTDGSAVRQLTSDASYDSWGARLSPDRGTLVFSRSPAGVHDRDPTKTSLWAIGADGSGLVELRPPGLDGWGLVGHPEWKPDGTALVMVGGPRTNAQIFVTDPRGQQPQDVTGDRPGTNIDPSFTPDGRDIVFVGCPRAICTPSSYEIYRIPAAGGEAERLTDDDLPDYDPVCAPVGHQLAWLTNISGGATGVWDVRIRDENGQIRRLVGDAGITSRPQYSPDGKTIFMHRISPGEEKFHIYSVRSDGRDLTDLTPTSTANDEYPSP